LLPQGCWDAWGNATQTFVSVSVDGGRTFFAPRLAGGPPGWSAMSFGDAVAFDTRSRLYVTWHSIARNWTAASVYVANSTDLGQGFESSSFTTRLQVGGGNSTAQENLALGLNDTVYLLWVALRSIGRSEPHGHLRPRNRRRSEGKSRANLPDVGFRRRPGAGRLDRGDCVPRRMGWLSGNCAERPSGLVRGPGERGQRVLRRGPDARPNVGPDDVYA